MESEMAAVGKGDKGAVEVEEMAAASAKEVAGGDMITLKSSDGKTFEVSKEAAKQLLEFLNEKINDGSTDGDIQLKIDSKTLEKVVDYFNKHANNSNPSGISLVDTAASEDLKEWDGKLVDNLRQDALYDLITAATILDIKGLLDACCKKVANMIKGSQSENLEEAPELVLPEELLEGAGNEELPECPNHVGVDFEEEGQTLYIYCID